MKEKLEKAKKLSIKEGAAYSVSDGFGLKYIAPYALFLGANNFYISLLTSLPTLLGRFFELHTIKLMSKISRNKISFFGALVQAILWLFVIVVGLFYYFNFNSNLSPLLLVIIYTLLIIFGTAIVPAWTSLMRDLVTENTGRYFGYRNRVCTFVVLISMLIAGFLLDYFKQTKVFLGFVIIFSIAFFARLTSSILLKKTYEPEFKQKKEFFFSFFDFIKQIKKNNFGRFVLFITLISLTTNIASPFFTVYLLKNLNFSYVFYILITITNSLSTLVFSPVWGKFADHYGNMKVIKICSFITPIIPLAYLLTPFVHNYILIIYLILIEILSGFAWAGLNLTMSNFVYDAVSRERMALCVTYFNIVEGIGIFVGATLGGLIASFNFVFFGLVPLLFIFLLSGVLRLLVPIFMLKQVKEVRNVKPFSYKEFKERISNLSFSTFINLFI
ncbi:MAG: MFS transporter [Candidatus Nanoarchaeia archaeon]|nr:MFS transporter [Candidatus Nanoarchaeia archaeon]